MVRTAFHIFSWRDAFSCLVLEGARQASRPVHQEHRQSGAGFGALTLGSFQCNMLRPERKTELPQNGCSWGSRPVGTRDRSSSLEDRLLQPDMRRRTEPLPRDFGPPQREQQAGATGIVDKSTWLSANSHMSRCNSRCRDSQVDPYG